MTRVIKKNGEKEDYDEKKLEGSILKAAISAGKSADDDVVEEVIKDTLNSYEGQDKVNSRDIREDILKELDEKEPSIADAWRKFDEKYKSGGD